jgi:hypothetical protein
MNLSTISQLLFYIGISVGITSASKLPVDGSTWPDTLVPFVLSLVVTIVGLVGWRLSISRLSSNIEKTEIASTHPQKLLALLHTEIDSLSERHKDLSLDEIQSIVTNLLEGYFIPIANQQQILYQELGMERAAHILITLSYAQRIFHRFQSAYADGHELESRSCIVEAIEGFMEID